MTDCQFLNPLVRDGTSQQNRAPRGLSPDHVRVDERGTAELLLYAREVARLLRFYDETNRPAGNWLDFLERDASVLAARLGAYPLDETRSSFDERKLEALTAPAATFGPAFAALFGPVFELARALESWRRLALPGLALSRELVRSVEFVLDDALRDALRYAKRAVALGFDVPLPDLASFGAPWGDLGVQPDVSLFPSNDVDDADERKRAVKLVSQAFERFYESFRRLKADAPAFLDETLRRHPEHRPHVALFLAVLELFRHAQGALNGLTARHLDFYYRQVLGLAPRPAQPDHVHVVFELAKSAAHPQHLVAENTDLVAKDPTGTPLVYGTDAELVVNRALLDPEHGLKTVFLSLSDGIVTGVHAAPDADSADGLGAKLEGDEPKWRTFGEQEMPNARLGFALSSPMFWLAEGTRTVILTFHLENEDFLCGEAAELVVRELEYNVVVEFTGEKGWIPAEVRSVDLGDDGKTLVYELRLASDLPPTARFNLKAHGEGFDTQDPTVRFVLDPLGLPGRILPADSPGDPEDDPAKPTIVDYSDDTETYATGTLVRFEGRLYQATNEIEEPGFRPTAHSDRWALIEYAFPYKYFERMRVKKLELEVEVSGMRNLMLENDHGVLNPAKPFHPFGPAPRKGSGFLVGAAEAFKKPLTELSLSLTWHGLPEKFSDHYLQYADPKPSIASLKGLFEVLTGGAWTAASVGPDEGSATTTPKLFVEDSAGSGKPAPGASFIVNVPEFEATPGTPRPTRFAANLRDGFLRITLQDDFRHGTYAVELAEFAKNQAATTPPNPPYTPVAADFTLDYAASTTVDYATFTRSEVEARVERLFQIGPFGQQEVVPAPLQAQAPGVTLSRSLVPEFRTRATNAPDTETAEGTLYVGLARLTPGQNLSLLFQMAEGSEDPSLPLSKVNWSYLTASGWADFQPAETIGDGTNGLIASGIVSFAIPKSATANATLLPSGLHWLRATVSRHARANPDAIAVHPQAVRASLRDAREDPPHLAAPLPAGSVTRLAAREAAIKSLAQYYASFGGQRRETDEAFRVRVAERLRHKQRAITIFDYERLVLDRFPEVYKVRCVNHTNASSEYAPGSVRLVVVPDLRNKNAVDPLRPRLALAKLAAIRAYLEELASDFADIEVVNPDYEEVFVRFNVRFHPGFDKGFYTGELAKDIVRFLSPWAYDDAIDLAFGGRIHRSAILNFIDERPYVDFVTDFAMDHRVPRPTAQNPHAIATFENVEEALATRSSAVLVSAAEHQIGDQIVSCDDPPPAAAPATPKPTQAPTLPPGSKRYLGNVRKRELHDLLHTTKQCQLDEIALDRRFAFSRIPDALALNYDFCAYCFPPGMSKR